MSSDSELKQEHHDIIRSFQHMKGLGVEPRKGWTDKLFVEERLTRYPRERHGLMQIKTSGQRLVCFLAGGDSYDEFITDLVYVVLSMSTAECIETLLFDHLFKPSAASASQEGEATAPLSQLEVRKEGYFLNRKVDVVPVKVPAARNIVEVEKGWKRIHDDLGAITDGTKLTASSQMSLNALGYLLMHLLRLMCLNRKSVHNAIIGTLNKHFNLLYGCEVSYFIPPPHDASFKKIDKSITRTNAPIKSLYCGLIATYMHNFSRAHMSRHTKSILITACLSPTKWVGMQIVKVFDSARRHTGLSADMLGNCVTSKATVTSMGRIAHVYRINGESHTPNNTLICEAGRELSGQISWKWARVIDDRYFGDYQDKANLHLLCRLSCILTVYDKGHLAVLSSPVPLPLMKREVQFAHKFKEMYDPSGSHDIGLTPECEKLIPNDDEIECKVTIIDLSVTN